MEKPVVVMGDLNVDMLFKQVAEVGRRPYELEVRSGGTAGNTAVALAHLGLPVEFLGAVGDGGYGRLLSKDLVSEGIGVRNLQVRQGASSLMIGYVVDTAGDILHSAAAWPRDKDPWAMRLQPADIDVTLLASAAWLHISGTSFQVEAFREGAAYAMEKAHEAGVPISLDLNFHLPRQDEPYWNTVHRAVEVAAVVLGSVTDDLPKLVPDMPVAEAARRISDGKRICVARMGAEGSLAVSPEEEVRMGVFPVAVLDAVGAGDSYNAGFIAGRLEGRSLVESLRMGSAVAALTISREGTRNSPTRAEVEALMAGAALA